MGQSSESTTQSSDHAVNRTKSLWTNYSTNINHKQWISELAYRLPKRYNWWTNYRCDPYSKLLEQHVSGESIRRFPRCLWHTLWQLKEMHEDKLNLLGVNLRLVLLFLDAYGMHYVFLSQDICVYLCLVLPMLYACSMHNIFLSKDVRVHNQIAAIWWNNMSVTRLWGQPLQHHNRAWRQGKPRWLLSLSDITGTTCQWRDCGANPYNITTLSGDKVNLVGCCLCLSLILLVLDAYGTPSGS